jgi:large subunit ribosomal protein L28
MGGLLVRLTSRSESATVRLPLGTAGWREITAMAKSDITGKRKLRSQNVSHSNIKTKRWQNVNVQTRRIWVPELGRFVTLNLTTRDIRTIDKIGLLQYAKRYRVRI